MSVNKTKTIDSLGIEASVRYAEDMQRLDPHLIQDSRFIPQSAEITSIRAQDASHPLFQVGQPTMWASFSPPPFAPAQNLFTFQLIPSLGTYEKTEDSTDRLEHWADVLKKPRENKQNNQPDSEEKERQTLLHMLSSIAKLDKTLNFINARRNQYQRG
jgi:hypothetical protein